MQIEILTSGYLEAKDASKHGFYLIIYFFLGYSS